MKFRGDEMCQKLIDAGKKPEKADLFLRKFRTNMQLKLRDEFCRIIKKVVTEDKKQEEQIETTSKDTSLAPGAH